MDSTPNPVSGTVLLLLLFSHYLIATMQCVGTGQAPTTLERNITSGGKQRNKKEDNTRNKN